MNTPIPSDNIGLFQKFHCQIQGEERGPYGLIELAGLLRCGDIAPATQVRRDGETAWIPLESLPEFPSLQAVPIETIAAHLESQEKTRSAKRNSALPLPATFAVILVVVAVLATVIFSGAPTTGPSSSPTEDPLPNGWRHIDLDDFSIACPAQIKSIETQRGSGYRSYRAETADGYFAVDIKDVPLDHSTAEYNVDFDNLKRSVLMDGSGEIKAETPIIVNGMYGRDAVYTQKVYAGTRTSGFRFIGGHGKMGAAWITTESPHISEADIERYITSFRFTK